MKYLFICSMVMCCAFLSAQTFHTNHYVGGGYAYDLMNEGTHVQGVTLSGNLLNINNKDFGVLGRIGCQIDNGFNFTLSLSMGSKLSRRLFFPVGLSYQVRHGLGDLGIYTSPMIWINERYTLMIPVTFSPMALSTGFSLLIKI